MLDPLPLNHERIRGPALGMFSRGMWVFPKISLNFWVFPEPLRAISLSSPGSRDYVTPSNLSNGKAPRVLIVSSNAIGVALKHPHHQRKIGREFLASLVRGYSKWILSVIEFIFESGSKVIVYK